MSNLNELLKILQEGGNNLSNFSTQEKKEYSPKVKIGGKALKVQGSMENLVIGLGMSPDDYLTDEKWQEALTLVKEIDIKVGELLEFFATKGGAIELPDFVKQQKEEYLNKQKEE